MNSQITLVSLVELFRQHQACGSELERAIHAVLQPGWFIRGPEVEVFEQAFASYSDVLFRVGVGNGLDANAVAVAVEPDPQTHNISPDRIREVIRASTRCIIPARLYGQSIQNAIHYPISPHKRPCYAVSH